MNRLQNRLRDDFLTRTIGEKTGRINFSEVEGFLCLWGWAKKQPWWGDFFKNHSFLIERWDREAFVNAIYRLLEK